MSKKRVAYAISAAVSTTAAILDDMKGPGSYVAGSFGAVTSGILAYCFQGASIDNPHGHAHGHACDHAHTDAHALAHGHVHVQESVQTPDDAQTDPLPDSRAIADEVPTVRTRLLPGQEEASNSWPNLISQFGLNTSSIAFTIANRYFLVTNLAHYAEYELDIGTVWGIVICDTVFKTLFDLTNELYETNAEVSELFTKKANDKPVYANWRIFKAISKNKGLRDFFAIVGTLEHAIVDDILPWLLFVPQSSWAYLAKGFRAFNHASIAQRALAILTPIFGGLIALTIVFQTILFEAEHSYMAYRAISGIETLRSLYDRMSLPNWMKSYFHYSINLMPLCHGAAAAAPVYVYLKKLFKLYEKGLFSSSSVAIIIKSIGTVLVTLFTFTGTAVGHYHSELREAKELLGKLD